MIQNFYCVNYFKISAIKILFQISETLQNLLFADCATSKLKDKNNLKQGTRFESSHE